MKRANQFIYIFEDCFADTFVTYKKEAKDEDEIRVRCKLYRGNREHPFEIGSASFCCKKTADVEAELRAQETGVFIKAIQKKWTLLSENPEAEDAEKEAVRPLYQKFCEGVSPFRRFLNYHFDDIAALRDWKISTIESYWNTLTNQIDAKLPRKELGQLTASDFDRMIEALNESWKDRTEKDYGEDRVEQFFSICYSMMEYASELYGIPNVMRMSKFYDDKNLKNPTETLAVRIEKRLRSKSLTDSEQEKSARLLMTGEQEKGRTIGTASQKFLGVRPCEGSGLRFGSRIPFISGRWRGRHYMLVQVKTDSSGHYNPDLKTINGYRALPIPKVLDKLIDREQEYAVEIRGIPEEEVWQAPLVAKKSGRPLKPTELSSISKSVLTESLGRDRSRQISLPIPAEETEDGQKLPLEENETSYQYRRNFCHILLNVLGMPLKRAQAMMGHEIPSVIRRRWKLYHEKELGEQMELLDQVILFPIADESERTSPWDQTDPRKEVFELEKLGEFKDGSTLNFHVKPYSDTDKVTLRLYIDCNEPSDELTLTAESEQELKVTSSAFFSLKEAPAGLNLRNAYLDMVFAPIPEVHESDYDGGTREEIEPDEENVGADYYDRLYEEAPSEIEEDVIGIHFETGYDRSDEEFAEDEI